MTIDHERIVRALPNYEIGEEIGRGAWGVVVVARHRQLGRAVAVKELPVAFAADPGVRKRFTSEARLLAGLDHPHIVPIYDYVEDEGLCLLVMELLAGGTVWSRFNTDGVSAAAACAIVVAAASALDHAHGHGVLHRDIKPENLLLSGSDTVKVSDFGIAKVVGGSASLATRTGEVLGTPAYMAPEQALGGELTAATDVYALGTVLYELLAGRLPFTDDGNALGLLYRHVHEDPQPLGDLRPDLPGPLVDVTMRAIAREPAERFSGAEGFALELTDAATTEWGAGWVRAAGVNVLATGRLGERLSAPPGAVAPSASTSTAQTRRTRAPATIADEPETPTTPGVGPAPSGLVPVSELVSERADRADEPPVQNIDLPTPLSDARAAASPRRSRRRLVLVLATVVAAAAVVALVVALAARSDGGATPKVATTTTAPLASPPRLAATVSVGPGVDHVAVMGGLVWVTVRDTESIAAIDPATNAVTRELPLGARPHAIVSSGDSLWVAMDGAELLRVVPGTDADSTTITHIAVDAPLAEVAEGEGAVWATEPANGALVRVDEQTSRVDATIAVGTAPDAVVVGDGAVWVVHRIADAPGAVTRVDPAINQVVATVTVGRGPDAAAFGAGSLWVANAPDGTVSRVEPSTNSVGKTILVGTTPKWVTVGNGAVWVTDPSSSRVLRVDPARGVVTDEVRVGGGAEASALEGRALWVVDQRDGTVSRIDTGG